MKGFSRKKWIIVGVAGFGVVAAIILAFVLSTQTPPREQIDNVQPGLVQQDTPLPANTCPSELNQVDGRPVAVYQERIYQMTKEVYDWVQENCDFNTHLGKPVLLNLGIEGFASYDVMTGRAGPFIFDKQAAQQNWGKDRVFFEFGYEINGKVLPEITYAQVDADTNVVSMTDGTIFKINSQSESEDFSMEIRFNDKWMIIYDHVRNLEVREGDTVVPGQTLGKVSLNNDGQTGYTEIMVKEGDGRTTSTDHCPLLFLELSLRLTYDRYFTQLMRDWETYLGDTTVHDDSAQVAPGCLVESLRS